MIFTTEQLDAMRAAQESHMNDVVDITTYTITTDSYGDTIYEPVTLSGVACGFNFAHGIEIDQGQVIVVDYDASVRFPLDTTIGINDKVTLRELAGETHSEVFEVFEYPRYGTTALIVNVKRISN